MAGELSVLGALDQGTRLQECRHRFYLWVRKALAKASPLGGGSAGD